MKDLPNNMKVSTKYKGRVAGSKDLFLWEVNGVMLKSKNIIAVQRKYLRQQGVMR